MEENGQRQVTSVEKCDKSRVSIRNSKTDRKYIHCWTREGQGVQREGRLSPLGMGEGGVTSSYSLHGNSIMCSDEFLAAFKVFFTLIPHIIICRLSTLRFSFGLIAASTSAVQNNKMQLGCKERLR